MKPKENKALNDVYLNEKVLNYVYCNKLNVITTEGSYDLKRQNLGKLFLPTGRIVANDPCCFFETDEFTIAVEPGNYPVSIYVACSSDDKRVALAMIAFSDKQPVKWEMALVQQQSISNLKDEGYYGYGVDSGTGGFMDKQTADKISENDLDVYELFQEQFDGTYTHTYCYAAGSINGGTKNDVIAFSSGWGDGCYPSYFGFDESGKPCVLVTDFLILD